MPVPQTTAQQIGCLIALIPPFVYPPIRVLMALIPVLIVPVNVAEHPTVTVPAKVEAPSTVVVPFTLRTPASVMMAPDPQAVQPLPIATVHAITVVAAE